MCEAVQEEPFDELPAWIFHAVPAPRTIPKIYLVPSILQLRNPIEGQPNAHDTWNPLNQTRCGSKDNELLTECRKVNKWKSYFVGLKPAR